MIALLISTVKLWLFKYLPDAVTEQGMTNAIYSNYSCTRWFKKNNISINKVDFTLNYYFILVTKFITCHFFTKKVKVAFPCLHLGQDIFKKNRILYHRREDEVKIDQSRPKTLGDFDMRPSVSLRSNILVKGYINLLTPSVCATILVLKIPLGS